jgi:hypothetical protein
VHHPLLEFLVAASGSSAVAGAVQQRQETAHAHFIERRELNRSPGKDRGKGQLTTRFTFCRAAPGRTCGPITQT